MRIRSLRPGMSLMEVMIALSLTTLVAGLTGGLMRWYVVNETRADTTFEELRLARSILGMVADDLRCVFRNEPFDIQPLVALMQSSAGGQAVASMAGMAQGGADASGQSGTGGASADMSSMLSGSSMMSSGGMVDSSSTSSTTSSSLPPGLIGSATTLEVDISRPPRVDEMITQTPDLMSGTLNDLPTDLKTVTYYVQGNQLNGVTDSLASFSTDVLYSDNSTLSSSGLVRRMIARNVLQKAYLDGQNELIMRTGTLISKDVVGIFFEYFDGTQWIQTWDSSSQGIPTVVRVSIAMQNPTTPTDKRLLAPVDLSMTSPVTLTESGVTVYSTLVTIPGAALATKPTATDDGSAELGL